MTVRCKTYIYGICFFLVFSCFAQNAAAQQAEEPSIQHQTGQMLMAGFRGFEVSDTSHIIRDIEKYNLGGVILFDYDVPSGTPERNIESGEQVKRLIRDLQKLSETTLLIGIDQEGGRVARLKPQRGFTASRSAQYFGELDSPDSTRFHARAQAGMLHDLGFNVNFTPVVDLNTNPENPVIGSIERSFSADPEVVTRHASIFLEEFTKQNILGVLKHFPGHGSAWNDSHAGMADVTDTWQSVELEPYQNLIDSGLSFGVMTAHVFNEHLDPEVPATLSEPVQTGILRDSLGFEGILFSDDMQMEAIRSFYGLETALKNAILAGVDVIIFANNSVYERDIIPRAVDIITTLVENGEISEERIAKSYDRIMKTKERLAK